MTLPESAPFTHDLIEPRDVGLDPLRLDVLRRRVALEIENGFLPSAQIAVARHGRLVSSHAWGADESQRYILQSVGRPFVASAVWKLMGEGRLDVSARVADLIPEFGTNGKEAVTIEQMMTHTGGLAFAPLGYPKMADRAARLAAMARWRQDEPPGRLQWHLTSTAWVLAELVERISGQTLSDYLHTEIARPLGLRTSLAVPPDEQATSVAPMVCTEENDVEIDPWGPWFLSNPGVVAAGEPAHCVVSSAADLALFYQGLLRSSLWAPGIVEEATRARVHAAPAGEQIYGGTEKEVSIGLFVMVAGDDPDMWMPATASPRTFGHGGSAYQLGWCDPDSGLSFAMTCNGYPKAGYDYSARGRALIRNVTNLAGDVVIS